MPHSTERKPKRIIPVVEPPYRYQLELDDDEVEKLVKCECPETVALKCWEMLKWKREGARLNAREFNGER